MKNLMMSERKFAEERRKIAIAKTARLLMTTVFILSTFAVNCFAADGSETINTAKALLEKATTAGGGLWAVWGIVQLGMNIKDSNGPGIGNAIWQILGGAVIIAAGVAIGKLDLSMSVAAPTA